MAKGLVQSSLNIYVMMLQRQLCHGSSGLVNSLIPCWVARGTALLGGGKRWRTDRSRGHWRWGLGWGGIMGLCLIWLFVSFSYFTSVNHMVLSETRSRTMDCTLRNQPKQVLLPFNPSGQIFWSQSYKNNWFSSHFCEKKLRHRESELVRAAVLRFESLRWSLPFYTWRL